MLFVVTCLDKPDALPRRMAVLDVHRAYLNDNEHPVELLLSGPLVEADGETMKGSHFLVEAPSREAVLAWSAGDPLAGQDVWGTVIIEAYFKRVDNLSGAGG